MEVILVTIHLGKAAWGGREEIGLLSTTSLDLAVELKELLDKSPNDYRTSIKRLPRHDQ